MIDRRTFIKGCAAAAFGAGAESMAVPALGAVKKAKAGSLTGRAEASEWLLRNGKHVISPNFVVRHSVCLQCHGECGIRAKVTRKGGRLVRLVENPWHPNTLINYIGTDKDAAATAATPGRLCARGVSGVQTLYDPCRITVPLKRTGPRGSNRWEPISWEQLIREVTEGGKLFSGIDDPLGKDVDVKGLRWLYEHRQDPIDPKNPDYGHVSNGLVFQGGRIVATRKTFQTRFAQSFGTVNNFEHTNICEQSHHIANGEAFSGKHNYHADLCNSEFVMFWGTAPGEANFPMQTLAMFSAEARARGCRIVVVDPVLPVTVTQDPNMQWVAVKPGTDGALAMGIIREMIDTGHYNRNFLVRPNDAAAKAAGELNSTNATFLVVTQKGDANEGRILTCQLAGISGKGAVVIDHSTEKPAAASGVSEAELEFSGKVNGLEVKSAFTLLAESARKNTLDEYSKICGVPAGTIRSLAKELTSHGRKAVAEFYRGIAQHPNGYYTGFAIDAINVLIGNLNWKGGASTGGGSFASGKGHYDLGKIPGLVPAATGLPITREKAFYEKSTEFKAKKAAGKSPYPAPRPWFPYSKDIYSEIIPSALQGYPYKAAVLIWHMATPLYAAPGQANEELLRGLKDPKKIPLIISSDIVIGDSTLYADYVVPDVTYMERYVQIGVPDTLMVKGTGVRWPVVEPLTGKKKDGTHYCYETFLIDVARRLGMAGFGKDAIPDSEGKLWPLDTPEDFYLKATANVAFDGSPCADATEDDIAVAGLSGYYSRFKECLKPEEWKKTLFVLSRGGRFEPASKRYEGDKLGHRMGKPLSIYSEKVALGRDSMTGKRFSGSPIWQKPLTALGRDAAALDAGKGMDLVIVSQKSPLQSHSRMPGCTVVREIRPENAAEINAADGKKLGLKTGDKVVVTTATGSRKCRVLLREGVAPGVLSFVIGYGHTGYGAASGRIGKRVIKGDPERARGVNLNPVMRLDPDVPMMALLDPIGGSASFYDTRAKIAKA